MITLISGTSRIGSNTQKVALTYQKILTDANVHHHLLDLSTHSVLLKNESFQEIENNYLIPADKFIFVIPEYNGSYPGIVKLMIDHSKVAPCWNHKKALLTGVSTGRAGNLRGMEHLTGSLMHMKITVHPNRLPISNVDKLIGDDHLISENSTLDAIKHQLAEFLKY